MGKGNIGSREIILIVSLVLSLSTFIILSAYLGRMIETIKTGKVAEVSTTTIVVVAEPSNIFNVSVYCLQNQINRGETIYTVINLTNNGPYEGNVDVDWWIEDDSGNKIVSDSTVINMSIGYTWSAVKGLIVPSGSGAGTYYFKVTAFATGYVGEGQDNFSVVLPSQPPSGPGNPPSPPPPTIPKKEIEIYYPNKITVLVNTSKEFYVVVRNTGAANITNVILILQGLELSWYTITPVNVTLIQNETQVFTINLQVPADAATKDYPVMVTVVSGEIVSPVQFVLSVKRVFDFSEIQEKITITEAEIEILKNETKNLEEKYINVNEINRLLSIIEEKLNATQQEVQAGNPVRASELIYEIEDLIEVVKDAIKAKQPVEVPMWSFFSVVLLIISSAVIMVSIGGVWLFMRKKRKEVPKKPDKSPIKQKDK